MKKRITLPLLSIMIVARLNSQIIITQSDMPSANDTIRYSNASISSLNFTPGLTGSNYNWNFAGLALTSQDVYQYKSSLNTFYFFYFTNKIGLKTADSIGVSTIQLKNIYSFYTKNSTVFKTEGIGYTYANIPLSNSYIDEDEIYQFPLKYGDHDSSTYYFDYNLSTYTSYIDYAQHGSRINDVDGWGSITTPYATYPNVLRVKSTIYTHDTITVFGLPILIDRTTVEYKWLSNTEKIPVLEISGTLVGSDYAVNSVKYRDGVRIVSAVLETADMESRETLIYPNPFRNFLCLKSGLSHCRYRIFDAYGKEVLTGSFSDFEEKDTELLLNGVYYVFISNKESTRSESFKIIKD